MRNTIAGLLAALVAGTAVAQNPNEAVPPKVKATAEHKRLARFAGEWTTAGEMNMAPDQPAMKTTGTETTRMLGDFWMVTKYQGEVFGESFTGVMTVGYDAKKQKYVGTWVCSVCDILYRYEGTMDKSGKELTLYTEGPDPATGKLTKMKDVLRLTDEGTKVLTSHAVGPDGKWHKFMTMTSTKK